MSNKQMKRIRKLKRIFGYTPRMEREMKRVVKGFGEKQRVGFADEVDMMIDRKVPIKPVLPEIVSKTSPYNDQEAP